jgi:hypothetical protein
VLLNCMREAYKSLPQYATPTGQAPRALPSPRCGKHASPVRRSPSGSSMWSASEPAHNDACLKQRLVLQCGVGDGGARAAGDVWACSDEPSRFRGFWRARARPAEEDGRGVPWGCAEQYQFSAATPTADTCFSGIPVGVFPRVEAGSVAHIGINDEVFSMEPPCALELRDLDTRFVFIKFLARSRASGFGDNRCRKDRLKRARDPLFMSCLTQGHTQRRLRRQ